MTEVQTPVILVTPIPVLIQIQFFQYYVKRFKDSEENHKILCYECKSGYLKVVREKVTKNCEMPKGKQLEPKQIDRFVNIKKIFRFLFLILHNKMYISPNRSAKELRIMFNVLSIQHIHKRLFESQAVCF